jgi:hypothetical protein
MVTRLATMLRQITAKSARPDWTLLALSFLLSATLVLTVQLIGS